MGFTKGRVEIMAGKEEKYREIAVNILKKYIDSEQSVISEYSGDFKKSAEILKNHVMKYLNALGYGEEKFAELAEGTWIFEELSDD